MFLSGLSLGLSRSLSLFLSGLSLSLRLSAVRLECEAGFVVRTGDLGCGVRGETDLENDLDRVDDLDRERDKDNDRERVHDLSGDLE